MKYVPNSVTRAASRAALKINKNSPTILVIAGVVGFGATAVLAAKASPKAQPVIEEHKAGREQIRENGDSQKSVVALYGETSLELARVYGPTIVVGTLSAAAILHGHRILKSRHVATMLAYSGLQDQFNAYRNRVGELVGDEKERAIYNGADLVYEEDPAHKGEYKLVAKYNEGDKDSFLRPWYDEANRNWTKNAESNYYFLKSVQTHMNHLLASRGHVFLNEVLDALGMERCPQGAVMGWLYGPNSVGDEYIDFGFMTSDNPDVIAFRNGNERVVRLNFNVDGVVWDKI